ncbi:hypothetical protein [Paragemmobacter straminiformis]|uniref:Uncharacterized protein n=1 Tax=Paragemmobacter straminiformis TaxID=2045119 RepID=A0A842I6D0_9RHOB|nr:hypothetical protein [Gemmobacter straminiformis]MBC2835209.1 hypothetical protein [Gemmobacter straminiformis]
MDYLIWSGAVLSLVGVAGLGWCIALAFKARKSGLPDDEIRKRLQKVVAINLGALALSFFGLMLVIVGVILK